MIALPLLLCAALAAAAPDRSAPPKPGPLRPFTVQLPQEIKLDNGLRVVFLERKRAPLVDVVAVVDAGVDTDPQDIVGLASFTAGMLTEGAGDLDTIAFADAVDALGAHIAASVEPEDAIASLHVGSAQLAPAMQLFSLALTRPRFDEHEWTRVQKQTLAGFRAQAQEPTELGPNSPLD